LRTIKYLIVGNTKYVVKWTGKHNQEIIKEDLLKQ
jgi:hypothetical protein